MKTITEDELLLAYSSGVLDPEKLPEIVSITGGHRLHPYQKQGVAMLLNERRMLFHWPPGLGKTPPAFAAVRILIDAGLIDEDHPALLISMAGGAELMQQHAAVCKTWTGVIPFSTAGRSGPPPATPESSVMLLTKAMASRYLAAWLEQAAPRIVILDEVGDGRNQGKQWGAIRQIADRAEYVLGLTGTIVQSHRTDLWNVMRLVHGSTGVEPYEWWRRQHIRWAMGVAPDGSPKEFDVDWIDRFKTWTWKAERCHRVTLADAGLKLPEIRYQVKWVDLPAKAAHEMRNAERFREGHGERTTKDVAADVDGKVHAGIRILQQSQADKSIIFCERLDLLERLKRELEAIKQPYVELTGNVTRKKRASLVERFSDGPGPMTLVGTKAFEIGLNLQVANLLISLGSSWNFAREEQRERRMCRIGSRHEVVWHYRILTESPHERDQEKSLLRKEAMVREVDG